MLGQPDAQTVMNLDFDASQPTTRGPSPSLTSHGRASSPELSAPKQKDATTPGNEQGTVQSTPPQSPSAARAAVAGFTPMRKGRVHGLDDSPSNRLNESERRTRAMEDMAAKGRAVDALRADRLKKPVTRKESAGGDVERRSAIPVWGGGTTMFHKEKTASHTLDPFERARAESERLRAAPSALKSSKASLASGTPRPLVMAPRPHSTLHGRQRAIQRSISPPPVAGPSSRPGVQPPHTARSEPWRPLTQYLPHQRMYDASDDDADFPALPRRAAAHQTFRQAPATSASKGKAPATGRTTPPPLTREEEDSDLEMARRDAEALNEDAARRIQEQLWAEERAYNRSHRTQSHVSADDPMDEDVFGDDDEEAEVLASDSEGSGDQAGGYDSFDDISDADAPDDKDEPAAQINIEPALGDDRAKAAARSGIFADTKARIRWSTPTHEPIAGMTQAKMVAGIDPVQLEQHIRAAYCLDDVYIGVVHAVGGTRAAEIDRVTLVTALDAMISLTCRAGTKALFSAARQDQNGPSLRPGTVLIDVHDEDLSTLWQESAHWAMAGVRLTVQKYHQPNSAFMVTLEGTRRNSQSVAHGVRRAARKLTPLKNVFRQYNLLHPGLGRAARDNLIKSVVARPMTLTSRKALGFGTVQYNIFARLTERDPDAAPSRLTGDAEVDGFPPLSAEMHWAVRDAFRRVAIIDGRLGDATPVDTPWDCGLCFAEDHPVGKCHLKEVDGWFKTYDEFLAANAPAERLDKPKFDTKGKTRGGPPRGGRGNGRGRGGSTRAGPARSTLPRRAGGA